MHDVWSDILVPSVREVLGRLSLVVPRVLALLALILLGWVSASIARRLILRILRIVDFDARCQRWGLTASLTRSGIRQLPSILAARIVFWTLFLVAILMGIEALEMPGTTGLSVLVLRFLPNLLVATLVVGGGWLVANFLGQAVLIGAVNAQVQAAPLLAAAARWLVVMFAGAAALTQLGIAREMVLLAFGIVLGGIVLALALAFGLAGKDLARELLEKHLRGLPIDRNSEGGE